ncbi:hypothetical protein [Erythrobacter sp. MTPC3]|uniref:hypothetical protein n=1 Tax=Erythrobacter sp. MTPC3 TaxID=3056564 RepID=UPI0036F42C73|tara:strand:+ start:574 stop:816 length:243 start_codon:yes stop_codon:yes gene_type:complete
MVRQGCLTAVALATVLPNDHSPNLRPAVWRELGKPPWKLGDDPASLMRLRLLPAPDFSSGSTSAATPTRATVKTAYADAR